MTKDEIADKLCDMMKQTAEVDIDRSAITEETTIASLGFDSLSILDLLYDVQHTFGLEFDAEELVTVQTVGALTDFLQAKLEDS